MLDKIITKLFYINVSSTNAVKQHFISYVNVISIRQLAERNLLKTPLVLLLLFLFCFTVKVNSQTGFQHLPSADSVKIASFSESSGNGFIYTNDILELQDTLNFGQVLYVAITGNNTTAEIGNPYKPFRDPWTAAQYARDSGDIDLITVFPGIYTAGDASDNPDFEVDVSDKVSSGLCVPDDTINYYFHRGTTIKNIGSSGVPLFYDTSYSTLNVYGAANFYNDSSNIFNIKNVNATIEFNKCITITSTAIVITGAAPSTVISGHYVETSNTRANYVSINRTGLDRGFFKYDVEHVYQEGNTWETMEIKNCDGFVNIEKLNARNFEPTNCHDAHFRINIGELSDTTATSNTYVFWVSGAQRSSFDITVGKARITDYFLAYWYNNDSNYFKLNCKDCRTSGTGGFPTIDFKFAGAAGNTKDVVVLSGNYYQESTGNKTPIYIRDGDKSDPKGILYLQDFSYINEGSSTYFIHAFSAGGTYPVIVKNAITNQNGVSPYIQIQGMPLYADPNFSKTRN